MSDMKQFANKIAEAAKRADVLHSAIAWMERNDRSEIMREPVIVVNQQWGSGAEGFGAAMHLISAKIISSIEKTAKDALAEAQEELAAIEAMFARLTEQENVP